MRFVYLSTDEMNRAFVRTWADRHSIAVECPTRTDRGVAGPADTILLDIDHLPPRLFETIFSCLDSSREAPTVAAHGYGRFGDELRGRGLTVYPRLRSRTLSALVSTSSDRAAVQEDADALTWVELA